MARFTPIVELVEDLCLRSGDILMRNKGLLLNCAKDVWNDLNETTLKLAERVKMPVRRLYHVNKKTNSIDLPCDYLRVSSVNVIDHNNICYPVYRNDSLLHDDLVDVSVAKDCACQYACGYTLCNSIKGYEVVNHTETDFTPTGDPLTFECVDKKVLMGSVLYAQKQYPQRIYESGVWTETILYTENIKLCEVDVDKNGCVCDTPENIDKVCDACGIGSNNNEQCCVGGTATTPPNATCNTWTYYCTSKADWFSVQCGQFNRGFAKGCNNIYNISELGNRLIFPHNFGWDKVLVRFYSDISLLDLQIPYMARETFMTGLLYYSTTNNPKKIQESSIYADKYSRQKWGLFLELNKYRLAEQQMIMNPPVYVPSFFTGYNNRW